MRSVPVVEMKAHLSSLLVEVERGEEIAITRHGRVIARLVPDAPRMASDVFRAFWGEADIDFEAPPDQPAEPVESVD